MCGYVHLSTGTQGGQERAIPGARVTGCKLPEMGVRAVFAVNHSAISPASINLFVSVVQQSQTVIFSSQAITGGKKDFFF